MDCAHQHLKDLNDFIVIIGKQSLHKPWHGDPIHLFSPVNQRGCSWPHLALYSTQKLLPLFVPFDSLSITVNCGAVLGICQISKLNMILTGIKNTCANISLVSQGGKTLRDTISKGPMSGLVCPCMVFLSSEIIGLLLCYGVFYC